MAYRNKTYVAFDADKDIRYYRLMTAWRQRDLSEFKFYNAHDLANIMSSSNDETIKRRLRERLTETKIFILLVGESTRFLHKFVRWEIEQAMKMNLPIIVVNLNGQRQLDNINCPSILKNELALHVSYNKIIIQKALEEWKDLHEEYKREGKTGPYYYFESVYKSLGL